MRSDGEGRGSTFFFELPIVVGTRDSVANGKEKESVECDEVLAGRSFLKFRSNTSIALKRHNSDRVSPEQNVFGISHEPQPAFYRADYSQRACETKRRFSYLRLELLTASKHQVGCEGSQNGKVIYLEEKSDLINTSRMMVDDQPSESTALSVLLVDDAGSN